MEYFVICPEVSAMGLGSNTIVDQSVHPPKISHLHYDFDVWLGDDLLEAFPCFIVSQRLAEALNKSRLTGYELRDVEISVSDMFRELDPVPELPPFAWLYVTGRPGEDDFGLDHEGRLVVSDTAIRILRTLNFDNGDVQEYR